MGRKPRQIPKGGIIIVCEGTDTEYNYISEAVAKAQELGVFPFANCKILQSIEDYKNDHPEDSKLKKLNGDSKELRYFSKIESSEELYEKYRKQPTRYLREAQLFINEDFFEEGWGVYDLDHHTDHRGAVDLLKSDDRLNVAFSSYSVEEWLLTHFERNPKAFEKSECKSGSGRKAKTIECRPGSGHPEDCGGQECLGGYLRHKGYIPDYNKSGKKFDPQGREIDRTGYFNDYSIDSEGKLKESLLINAAWHKSQGKVDKRFETNPYSDVGDLLQRIFDDHRKYTWVVPSNNTIGFGDYLMTIEVEDNEIRISNKGKKNILFGTDYIKYLHVNAADIHPQSPTISSSLYIEPGETKNLPFLANSLLKLTQEENHLIVELT